MQEFHDFQEKWKAAIRANLDPPERANEKFMAGHELTKALQASGRSIDPHLGPLVEAIGRWDRHADETLFSTMEYSGAGILAAVPKLFAALRTHGMWCRPSHLSRALANASRFDRSVISELRGMLSDEKEQTRTAAMNVLGMIGPAARPASQQLLVFQNGSESERCGMIYSLAKQENPSAEFLDLLDVALRDSNGYVRVAALHALEQLTPEADRFVPRLIECCDWTEPLHDVVLPEQAVDALGRYGPRARAALPRLIRFINGPISGRTVEVKCVREAIERISPQTLSELPVVKPPLRETPVDENEPLFAVMHEERQCYIDRQGRLVIQRDFSWGKPFSDGRAIVGIEKRVVIIDRQGREVFGSCWDEIHPYSEGLAAVKKDEKWGFVDLDGRVAIEPKYDSVTAFSEGLAGCELGRSELKSGTLSRALHGRRGFIDRRGNVVIRIEWLDAYSFHDGRALVCTGGVMAPNAFWNNRETLHYKKYGYIDRTGKLVIDGNYMLPHPFSEGRAIVQMDSRIASGRYGYIDTNGRQIVPIWYSSATAFKDGLATVTLRGRKNRGKHFVIDPDGNVVAELPFPHMGGFSEGLAVVRTEAGCGFIDLACRWVVEPQFDDCQAFKNGLAEVQRGDWYGLIDRSGEFIWGPTPEGGIHRVFESEWLD
ncbi:MAG TPA: WG repeat-containing protein [Humisphaera sp.]|jgi:hypothetical protein|nr:WG repeat-containing protein [Humisphaera sp.]